MRTSALFVSALLVTACANFQLPAPSGGTAGTGGGATGGGTAGTSSSVAADIVRLTNEARARNGQRPLASSSRLTEAARLHAQQMAAYQRSAHEIPGAQYPDLESRLHAAGYVYSSAAENIAWNQSSPESVMNSWMNSSGHRANILDPKLTEIGAAMARSSKGEPYWIQVFGSPR